MPKHDNWVPERAIEYSFGETVDSLIRDSRPLGPFGLAEFQYTFRLRSLNFRVGPWDHDGLLQSGASAISF
jgi:hypothetical protein